MGSYLEVLVFIPTTRHLTPNHFSSASWRQPPDEKSEPHRLQKSRAKNKWKPSATWLFLEIISVKIMTDIGEKG